jgi:hypothetical protein
MSGYGNDPGRYDDIPGLVWYSRSRKVRGSDLALGDWLDSLDHRGARMIYGIWFGDSAEATSHHYTADESPVRTVMFCGGDTEAVRVDVECDVVDPDSQVQPDGSPL